MAKRDLHASTRQLLAFFAPEPQDGPVDAVFYDLAHEIAQTSCGAEMTVALRKLLECRDAWRRGATKRPL